MPTSHFELFVANRYLRAHRKEAVISLITAISVIGVAAGVMSLVVALAVTNGFHNTLERSLLGATAHINIEERKVLTGIENWRDLADKIAHQPHVVAVAPALYTPVFMLGPVNQSGAVLKGVDIDAEMKISSALRHLKQGDVNRLRNPDAKPPGLIIGARMRDNTGFVNNSPVNVIVPDEAGGMEFASNRPFYVSGIFETGFYDVDANWTYTSLASVQHALGLTDVVSTLEVNIDDPDQAPAVAKALEGLVAPRYTATPWQEQNRPIFSALAMERIITMIVIGLILLVAALNILITLVMMVMEKYRDIAILMSMGARPQQIRRIFMLQGLLIGTVGSAIGLVAGYGICYACETYQLIRIPEAVYSMSFVPFESRWTDGIWIAAVAIVVSFLATLYPARNATRIAPAEVLRYE